LSTLSINLDELIEDEEIVFAVGAGLHYEADMKAWIRHSTDKSLYVETTVVSYALRTSTVWDLTLSVDSVTGTGTYATWLVSNDLRAEEMHYGLQVGEDIFPDGFLFVKNIVNGPFGSGVLTGISATAAGPEEDDYREGTSGWNWNQRQSAGVLGQPNFQSIFAINSLIDIYLYVKQDARIPPIVKSLVDATLQNIRAIEEGDQYYGNVNSTYGSPGHVISYLQENPVSTNSSTIPLYYAKPWTVPEYIRGVAFVYRTIGNDTINGADYPTWYARMLNTGNIIPTPLTGATLLFTWKLWGQYFTWNQDAVWIMSQESLSGPSTMRTPKQWNAIPGDTPDIGRE
jgi:hypothetical protein